MDLGSLGIAGSVGRKWAKEQGLGAQRPAWGEYQDP